MDSPSWKHMWLRAEDPMQAFRIWLDAQWPHPTEGSWLILAAKTYGKDPEVPREMVAPRAPMPDDPF